MTPEAEEFIARAVDTIHQLEIVMLLRGSSDRSWRVDEIAAALGMTDATVASGVSGLHAHGVLSADDANQVAYRYEPSSIVLHAGVESLAAVYEADPLAVLEAVLSKPPRALRTFSDPFLFRRQAGPVGVLHGGGIRTNDRRPMTPVAIIDENQTAASRRDQ